LVEQDKVDFLFATVGIRRHLRPAIRRDGRVIYQLRDGGAVSDEARLVRVSQVTDGAAFFALSLASSGSGRARLL
jgi:hypothetical protein